jgi:hypothetical protein
LGVSYFALQHFHRERVAAPNDRIAAQERLLTDYIMLQSRRDGPI